MLSLNIKTIIIVFLLFCSIQLKADGPPVDSLGNIRGKYVSIKLTQIQIDHLQKNRYLELTVAQQKKVAFLKLPKFVDIVDPNYNDCTCGMIYGIWYTLSEVAFPYRDTSSARAYNSDPEGANFYNNYSKEYNENELFIGTDAQLYYMGKSITLKEFESIIQKKLADSNNKYLFVFVPPQKENPNWSKIQNSRSVILKRLSPLVKKVYWA